VDGDLREANDASDALLLNVSVSMMSRWQESAVALFGIAMETGASDRGGRTLVSSENCNQAIVKDV